MINREKSYTGFVFKKYEAPEQSMFDRLLEIFKELVTHTSGDVDEALDWLNELDKENSIKLLLTDLHPSKKFVKHFNEQNNDHISYRQTPLDASNYTGSLEDLKTMMNSFHHMPPKIASSILNNAQEQKQPILIYEMAENKIPFILWLLLLPISLTIVGVMALFLLPFVKPLHWKDVLFTYLIPVIPFFYAWDGQASMPRMYSFNDIEDELLPPKNKDYVWEVKVAKKENGKKYEKANKKK